VPDFRRFPTSWRDIASGPKLSFLKRARRQTRQDFQQVVQGNQPRREAGGGDLGGNPRLRSAIQAAHAQSMPNDNIEGVIEYIDSDEFVEATPKSLRLRKRILDTTARNQAASNAA